MRKLKEDFVQLLLIISLSIGFGGVLLMFFATSLAVSLIESATPFLMAVLGLCLLGAAVALVMLLFQNARLMAGSILSIVDGVVSIVLWLMSIAALFSMVGKGLTVLGLLIGPLVIAMTAIVALIRGEGSILLAVIVLAAFAGAANAASYWAEMLYEQRIDKDCEREAQRRRARPPADKAPDATA